MADLERREGDSTSLFPLDADIIDRLRDSVVTGVPDPEFAARFFKHGRVEENGEVLSFAAALGGSFRSGDLSGVFTMSSMFTYAAIAHSALKRGLDIPIVIEEDIDAANRILLENAPTVAPSSLSREAQRRVTQHFSDILTKPEERLVKALNAIVNSRLRGPVDVDSLQLLESNAHYGASVIYFPMAAAHKRISIQYN